MAEKQQQGNSLATTNTSKEVSKEQTKVSALQKLEHQMNAAPNLRTALTLPYWEKEFVTIYEKVTGKKDGKNKFMDEALSLAEIAMDNPKIAECSRVSVGLALRTIARTGLSLKAPGHLYPIPIAKNLKIQVGAHGKKQMLRVMPNVKFIHEANIVVIGDIFNIDKLNNRISKHESTEKSVKNVKALEEIVASYVRLEYNDNRIVDVVVYYEDLAKARSASKNKGEGNTWVTWPGEMAKKVAYHRLFKNYWVPTDAQIELSDVKEDEEEKTVDTNYTVHPDFMPEAETVETKDGDKVDTSSGEVLNEKKEDKPKDFFGND